jgi:hypothetical protein
LTTLSIFFRFSVQFIGRLFLQLIASASENLHRPYGLALSDSFLYWTEKDAGKIQRLSLNNLSLPIETLRTENRVLFDIKLFDNTSQTG